jgi:hypothetical protein
MARKPVMLGVCSLENSSIPSIFPDSGIQLEEAASRHRHVPQTSGLYFEIHHWKFYILRFKKLQGYLLNMVCRDPAPLRGVKP